MSRASRVPGILHGGETDPRCGPAGLSVPVRRCLMKRLLALALSITACGPPEPAVTGTATYTAGSALPSCAVLEATLLELAGPGTPGRLIGSTLVGGPRALADRLRIPYDPAQIDTTRRYGVRLACSRTGACCT